MGLSRRLKPFLLAAGERCLWGMAWFLILEGKILKEIDG